MAANASDPSPPASTQNDKTHTVGFRQLRSLKSLFDLIYSENSIPGDALYFTHVSPTDAVRIDEERERCRRKFRFRRYYPDRQLLIIATNTALHERLHLNFYDGAFFSRLVRLGPCRDWHSMGRATFPTYPLEPSGRLSYGEGDSTGGPGARCAADRWPTLVVEGGHSRSLDQLRVDLGWWFTASDHEVKIVVLLKFDRKLELIVVEKWVEEIPEGARRMTRGRVAQLQPVCRQSVVISRDKTTDPVSYHVTGAPLTYEFRLLFLRDPGPGEGDITVNVEDLQIWASDIWSWVDD